MCMAMRRRHLRNEIAFLVVNPQFNDNKEVCGVYALSHSVGVIPQRNIRPGSRTGLGPASDGRLIRRPGSAESLTIESRSIKAAHASLSSSEHFAGAVDPTRASLWQLGGGNPVDPVCESDGRDVGPHCPRLRGGRESLAQIYRDPGFHCFSDWQDLKRNDVAYFYARSFAYLRIHFKPMALVPVRLERGPKGMAIDDAFHCRHTPRRELRPRLLWQHYKGARASLLALCRSPNS